MPSNTFPEQADLLGSITPNLYTPLLWAYEMDSKYRNDIIQTLSKGLEVLSEACPYLAAQINVEGNLIEYKKHIPLLVKDFREDEFPNLDALKTASFPVQQLEGSKLLPLAGLPSSLEGTTRPVLVVQANFIEKGLLLCIAGEHTVMDGAGLAFVLSLFDKTCRGEPIRPEEAAMCNMSRTEPVAPFPNVESFVPGEELRNLTPGKGSIELRTDGGACDSKVVSEDSSASTTNSGSNTIAANTSSCEAAGSKIAWNVFRVSTESQKALKETVTAALPLSTDVKNPLFVSTNDVVTAFLWQAIMRVRSKRGLFSQAQKQGGPSLPATTFCRAVDMRGFMGLPPTYPGNMALHTYTTISLNQLLSINNDSESEQASVLHAVGDAAVALRKDLGDKDGLIHQMRSLVTLLLQHKVYKGGKMGTGVGIYPGANLKLGTRDLILSSWASMRVSELTFGLACGTSLAVRRPLFMPLEGLLYILPLQANGAMDLLFSLSEVDLQGLREDTIFCKYAAWIG